MSLVRYGSWSWATDTALSHRRSIPRFCPSDRRVAAEIPGAIQPAFKSKVKPLIQQRTLKASRRVSTVEKMHTADVATPVSSAKKRHCRGFGNCVRNPLVAISAPSAHTVRLHCAPAMARRLSTTVHHDRAVAPVMRATTRYQDLAKLEA
jgi:hypothetical protein